MLIGDCMKVISIIEPYATLIKEKKKYIETRSWKTSYRGELYIYASISKPPKEWLDNKELMNLLDNVPLNFGYIICKCKLVDCIYMNKEYIEKLRKENYQEYICGKYEEGRYGWVLEDIEPLKYPVKAKGQLSIWNYYDEFELMNIMDNIDYGWKDKYGYCHFNVDDSFSEDYILQSPNELLESKLGVCWDQVELERYLLKSNEWNIKTYFIVHYEGNCPTHTFLTFEKNNKYYWFEHSWNQFKGIHEYNSMNALLKDVRNKFICNELNNKYNENNLVLREYFKPKYGLSVIDFFKHCESNDSIIL